MLALIPALALPATAGATTLLGSGSSAEQPILLSLFKGYNKVHHSIRFLYRPDGGNAGAKDLQANPRRSQFAVNTRPPLTSDSGLTYVQLFLDGLCVGVNPVNHLSNLSLGATKDIFTDVATNWSQVGGSNLTTTIDPIGRNSSAGSYTFFQQAVLGKQTQASNVNALTSDGLVANAIKRDNNAIGYVGLSHSGTGSGVKRLRLNNVPCDDAHIKNETYPLWRFIWGVIPNSHPNTQVENFFDWVRTSKAAGVIISKSGAVPEFNKK